MTDINTAPQTITQSTVGYLYTSIAGALRRMGYDIVGRSVGFLQGGTGASQRTMEDKLREYHVSILDFGAVRDGTGSPTTAIDTALANANNYAIATTTYNNTIFFPPGYYRINNLLNLAANTSAATTYGINLVGSGDQVTHLYFYSADATATSVITTATGVNDRGLVFGIRGLHLKYMGSSTRTDFHGIMATHKINMVRSTVEGFRGDGVKFDTSLAGNNTWCVFFAKFAHSTFKNNIGNGVFVRYGANANLFYGCIFSGNGSDGFEHNTDGQATYGNLVMGGYSTNNTGYGYNLATGTNVQVYSAGAFGNHAADDVYVGDNLARSWLAFSRLTGTGQVRLPGNSAWGTTSGASAWHVADIQVWWSGTRGYGVT